MKKKQRNKVLTGLLAAIMAAAMLAGCGQEENKESNQETTGAVAETETAKEQSADKEEISLVFAQDLGTDEKSNQVIQSILEEYTAKTGVEVRLESLPSADYQTWLTTQFAANRGPDVYSGIIYNMTTDYQNGQLYNFKELYDSESSYDPGKKWGEALPEYINERMYITADDVPGYPTSTSVVRIFCNKDIFAAAGAEIPETWAEFMRACEQIKESGITPFAFPNATIDDLSWLWFSNSVCGQIDHEIVAALDAGGNGYVELAEICKGMDEGKIDFDNENLQAAFTLMKEFSQYWTSDYNGLDRATAQEMFARGEVAMVQAMSINLEAIDSMIGGAFEYVVIPVPTVTKETNVNAMGKSVILGGQPDTIYGINKSLETDEIKLEAAINFVQYISSPEIQLRLAEEINRIPLSLSTQLPERLEGFVITEEPLRMPFFTGINEKLRNYFHRSGQEYLSDAITLEDFTDTINQSYREVLEEIKTENGWTADNNYGMN